MQRSNSIRSHRSMRRSASMRARLDAELAAQTTLTTAETRHLRQLYDAGNFPSHFASAREFELYILSNFGVSVDARHPGPLQDALKPPGEVPRARPEDGDTTENGLNIPFASSGPDAARMNPSRGEGRERSGGLSMNGDRGGRHRRDHDGPPVTLVSCDHLLLIMAVVKRASLSDGNDDVARAFRALTDPAFGAPTPNAAGAFGMRSPLSPTGAASPLGSGSPRFPASGARAGNSHNSSSPSSAASPQSGPLPTDGTFGVDRLRQVANNFGLDVGELMPTLSAAGFGGLTRGGIAGTSSAAMGGTNRPAPLSSSSALGDEMGFDVFRRMLEVPPSRGGVDSRGDDPFDALAPGAAPAPAQSTAATMRVGRRVDFSSGDKKNQPAPVTAAATTSPTTVTPGAGGPTTTSGGPTVDATAATAAQQLGGSKSLNSSQGGPQQQQQADPFDQWVRDMEYKSHDIQHLLDGVEKRRRRERRRQGRLAAGLAGSSGKATNATTSGGGLGRSGGGLVMVAEVSSDGSSSSDDDSGELHMYGANARSSPAPARPYPISQSSLPAVQGASGSSLSPQNINASSVALGLRPSPAATTTTGPRGHSNTGGGGVNNAAAASANDEARRRGFFVERDVGVAVPLPPHPGTERMTRAALMGSLLRSSQKSDANAVKEAARVAAELEARRRSVSERRAQELRVIRGGGEGANSNGTRESPPAGHSVSTSALLANFDPTRFPAGGVPHGRSYAQAVPGGGTYPKSLTPIPGTMTGAGYSPGSGSLAAQYATSPDRATSVGAVSMGRNKLAPMPARGGAVSGPASFGLAPLPQMALRGGAGGLSPNRTKYQF
jgi:hypothetical protein